MTGPLSRSPATGEVLTAPDAVGDADAADTDGEGAAARRPSPVPRRPSAPAPEPDERPPAESAGQDEPAATGPEPDGGAAVVDERAGAAEPADEVPPEADAPAPPVAPPVTEAVPAPPPATDAVPAVDQAPPTDAVPAADQAPPTDVVPPADQPTEFVPAAEPPPTEAVPAADDEADAEAERSPVDRAARTQDLDPAALTPAEQAERTGPTEQSLSSVSLTERFALPNLPASLDVSTTRPVSTNPAPLTPAGPPTTPPGATAPAATPPRTPAGRGFSTEPVSSVPIPGRATGPVRVGPSSSPPSVPFPAQPGPRSGPFPAQPGGPRTGPGRAVGPQGRSGPPRRSPVLDPDRVRDDRVGLATARGRRPGAVVLALVLGLLLGGLVGGAAGYLLGTPAAASSLVRPVPPVGVDAVDAVDATAAAGPATAGPAELNAFLTAEVTRLSDGAFATAVAERLGRTDPPGLDVAREPGTALLRITGTDRDATSALAATTAAVQVYTERRDAENRAALDAAQAGIDAVVTALGQPAPGDTGLLARIERLRDLRADLAVRAAAAGPSVAVLDPPAPLAPGPPRWMLWAALGALAGALLALLLLALRRGRVPALLEHGAVEAHVGTLLQPPVRLASRWPERLTGGPGSPERRTARLLLAQLLGEREPAGRVIAVLGGSAGSRADAVAVLLAVAAAERAATALVRLGARHRGRDPLERVLPMDPDGRGRPLVDGLTVLDADTDDVPGGLDALIAAQARRAALVVLDAGTAGGDSDLPTALRAADLVVLVARAGVDRPEDVAVVGAALRAGRAGVSGVIVGSI